MYIIIITTYVSHHTYKGLRRSIDIFRGILIFKCVFEIDLPACSYSSFIRIVIIYMCVIIVTHGRFVYTTRNIIIIIIIIVTNTYTIILMVRSKIHFRSVIDTLAMVRRSLEYNMWSYFEDSTSVATAVAAIAIKRLRCMYCGRTKTTHVSKLISFSAAKSRHVVLV